MFPEKSLLAFASWWMNRVGLDPINHIFSCRNDVPSITSYPTISLYLNWTVAEKLILLLDPDTANYIILDIKSPVEPEYIKILIALSLIYPSVTRVVRTMRSKSFIFAASSSMGIPSCLSTAPFTAEHPQLWYTNTADWLFLERNDSIPLCIGRRIVHLIEQVVMA